MMNVYLIPEHGILGAAIATSISVLIYNLVKSVFIYFKFNLHPFSIGLMKVFVVLGLFIGLFLLLPDTGWPIINMIYKTLLLGIGYITIAYFWKISLDANELGEQILGRLIKNK